MAPSTYLFLLAGIASVSASSTLNDWNKPCTSGKCTYFTGNGRNKAFGVLSLEGPTSALSDITPAAGWEITGCSADWEDGPAQVRITCNGSDEAKASCSAVFEGDTAVDTIVRLPENCGAGPFARIVSTVDVTEDGPEEHDVILDYAFDQITHERGEVAFEVTSTNVEDVITGDSSGPLQASRFARRVQSGHSLVSRITKSKTFNLPPINLHRDFNLFNASIDCPATAAGAGFSAGLDVDVNVGVDAQVAFGFTVSGKIFWPKITKFEVFGNLNGSAGADFHIAAHATGNLDTGNIQLYSTNLPGLSIPGILKVGPSFNVHGQLTANLEVEADVKTGVNWVWPNVQMVFPQSQGSSSAQASHVDTPFELSVDPTISAKGDITAHVIPRVELGVNVLSGLASASVYLDLDASATLNLQIDASADAHTRRDASGTANGCAKLDGAINIQAGAQGEIKGLFDKDATFPIYQGNLNVFSKCFGNPTSAPLRARHAVRALPRSAVAKRDLVCPDLSLAALEKALGF